MKKIALMIAALGTTLAFTACQDSADDHPTLGTTQGQVVDILAVPETAAEPLQFTPENIDGHVHMAASKPTEYGFAAPVSYQVEIALNSDFTTPKVEGCPASVVLPTAFQNPAEINPKYKEISAAMIEMLNIESTDQVPTPYYEVYVRLIANVITTAGQTYPNTMLMSNTVSLQEVSVGYLDVVEAGRPTGIFLRGGMNGWGASDAWEFLSTSTPNVYEIDDVEIAEGTEFKVADANWQTINYGASAEALKIGEDYELVSGSQTNITMPENFSGRVQLTVDGSKYTILFESNADVPGMPTGVYIRGDFNSWSAAPASEFVTTDIKNVWTIANITITPGGFKIADEGWGPINLGSNGEAIVVGEPYELKLNSQDNLAVDTEFVGSVTLKIKGDNYYLTLTPVE